MDTISSTTPPPSIILVNTTGFYTDTPQVPTHGESDLDITTPDRKYMIIGCVLGIVMLVLLMIGSIFAIKLYRRNRAKEAIKTNEENQEEEGEQGHFSLPPPSYTSQNGSSKRLALSSILDPGSQFSLAVQRASEIPNSPTSPIP